MSDIVDLSARELRALIGRKALSPVELLDASLDRIEAVNPIVNAVVTLDEGRARDAAKRAEAAVMAGDDLAPLHGLPVLVKDLTATAGLRTTRGSLVFKDEVPGEDDVVVARVRKAGGIILGKTNTPEFGAGANTINRVFGATVNPFDPTLSVSGSSGGAAAALAAGMAPLATGTDLGGSVRTPSSFCGTVGHRASPGLISRSARLFGWSPLSVDGPMARDAGDAALLLAAMAGSDQRDPLSLAIDPSAFLNLPPADPARLRVAFSEDLGCAPIARSVRQAFRDKAARLAPLFARAEWRDPDLGPAHETFETLRGIEFIEAYGAIEAAHRPLLAAPVIENLASARQIRVDQIARALAAQTELYRRMQALFAEIDLLICPAASVPPFPIGEIAVREIDGEKMASYITWIAISYALTLSTHPVTVIPCGLGPTGLPFGLQLVGPARGDGATLAAAAAIEAAVAGDSDLARPRPDIAALVARAQDSRAGAMPPSLMPGPAAA